MPQVPAAHPLPPKAGGDRAPTPDAAATCPNQRSGRCMALASDTPVPTPTGWSILSRLRPGSRVLDQEGEPCTVTAVCARAKQDVFRIFFDDDSSLIAGARQPWVTLTHSRRFRMHTKRLQPVQLGVHVHAAMHGGHPFVHDPQARPHPEGVHALHTAGPAAEVAGTLLECRSLPAGALAGRRNFQQGGHHMPRRRRAPLPEPGRSRRREMAHPEKLWGHSDVCPDPGARATLLDPD